MAQLHQATAFNRYPGIFRAARRYFVEERGFAPDGGGLRLLSFGCSNGAEIQTLRSYFPAAVIYGCDIDLEAARNPAVRNSGVIFDSTPAEIAAHGPYDAVFALSVLCWSPVPAVPFQIAEHFPFSEFEDHCGYLDASLASGGLFILNNASYRFADSSVIAGYAPLRSHLIPTNGEVSKWARDGTQMSARHDLLHEGYWYFAHRLMEGCDPVDAWFRDAIFVKGAAEPLSQTGAARPDRTLREVKARLSGPVPEDQSLLRCNLSETLFEDGEGQYWLRTEWSRSCGGQTERFGEHWQRATGEQLDGTMPPVAAEKGYSWPF